MPKDNVNRLPTEGGLSTPSTVKDAIAVVGMGCLLPNARNPQEFWQNLIEEKDSTSLITEDEIGVDPDILFDPAKGTRDRYYWKRGGYVRNFYFDSRGYHLPPEQLDGLDNVFKWSLYVSRQALEDSGYLNDQDALAKCGLILGNLTFPIMTSDRLVIPIYQQALDESLGALLDEPDFHLERLPELDHAPPHTPKLVADEGNLFIGGYPAGIVAQALALQGGHLAMDAACATSLYAIKLACHYLRSGKADMMLAGAVSGADPYYLHMGFSIFQAYPEEGEHSSPLDSTSRGLRCAEGAGMFVLKRYQDAVRDGDKVYALIRGGGLSNDGQGKHTLTPNPKGQKLAFERAYANAAISPEHIDYVECHATGTPLGDVTELNSMESFFGPYGEMPLIGSVKSNFGHLLTAAAMASMMKAILGMNEGIIPATINVEHPLSSQEKMITEAQIVRTATPWPSEQARRFVGVTAFGFGGTNAHLVLENNSAAYQSTEVLSSAATPSPSADIPLAIVGMDAFFGSCEGLDAFYQTLYEGKQHFNPLPETRWKGMEAYPNLLAEYGLTDGAPLGAYIENFEMDFLYFKSPPSPVDQPTPQHLLMLKVADQAINDAGLQKGGNVAVLIAMGAELASHEYRGRVDLTWQMKGALQRAGITLSEREEEALKEIAKDALHYPANVNQYTSFIGNVIATRISALWDFVGPSFTVSVEENSIWKALDVAQILLASNEADAVVVGAVDLSGGIENVLLRHRMIEHHTQTGINSGSPTLSYDQEVNGWMVGEGAGAVVLKPQQQAIAEGDRIYATIEAVATASPKLDSSDLPPASERSLERSLLYDAISADTITKAASRALEQANISDVSQIGYLEVYGSGVASEDQAEIEGLLQAYRRDDASDEQANQLDIALGSAKANIGHTYCASGMASLIKTALCLHHRFIPTTPNWSAPKDLAQWAGSRFYVPTSSRPWFKPNIQDGAPEAKRLAAISGFGVDGMAAHLILSDHQSDNPASKAVEPTYNKVDGAYLFPLSGNNQAELEARLDDLEALIKENGPLSAVANQVIPRFDTKMTYALSICGQAHELEREIERARKGITQAFAKGKDWNTPRGSCFTINPLGVAKDGTGTVAFVYPGAFNSYIGLGQDLYRLSPWLHEHLGESTSNLSRSTGEKSLYPRSMSHLSKEELDAQQDALIEDALTTMESGLAFSVASTQLLRREFGVQPDAAFGYSLGESSMMWALRLWTDGDQASEMSRDSELFRSRLSGPKLAVADYWSNETGEAVETPVAWHTYVLMSPAEKVQPVVDEVPNVYLTIINSPKEVVIAGDPDACQRVIEKVGGHSLRAPFDHVLHCPPMRSEYDEFRRLHQLPINQALLGDESVLPAENRLPTLYSASMYGPVPLSASEVDATGPQLDHHVAKVSCEQLDFPRLVNQVYANGARIFIELGASRTCTRWVGAILKKQPHLSIAINKKGVDDHTSILRVLAKLVAHKVPVDLSPLYDAQMDTDAQKRTLMRPVITGGVRLHETIVTEAHKAHFAQARKASEEAAIDANGSDDFSRSRFASSDDFSRSLQAQTSEARPEQSRRVVTTSVPRTTEVVTTSVPRTTEVVTTSPKRTTEVVTTSPKRTTEVVTTSIPIKPTSDLENRLPSETQNQPMHNVQPMSREASSAPAIRPDSLTHTTQSTPSTYVVSASGWSRWQQVQLELLTELQNSARLSQGHQAFLSRRQDASQQISQLIAWQMALLESSSPAQLALDEPSSADESETSLTSESTVQTPLMPPQEDVSEPAAMVAEPAPPPATVTPPKAVVEAKVASGRPNPVAKAPAMPALRPLSAVKPVLPPVAPPTAASKPVSSPATTAMRAQTPAKAAKEVVWDEADMLEFAQGKIANVFGPEYAIIDTYHRRVRLPTPPYLLVSRVTKLSATRGKFEPCSLTTEYDIPMDGWYLVDGQIPWAVAVESGQCDLLLISYLGIDFEAKGERIYRLLDATLTFLDTIPMAGDTLRYDISINGYARSGPSLLFFFSYNCYIDDRLVLTMRNGCAGFFSDKELAEGQGVIFTDSEKAEFERVEAQHIEPLWRCAKTSFTHADLVLASEGKMGECFGAAYDQGALNPSLRLSPPSMLMMNRIVSIDSHGGRWGLGLVMAEKDLAPDDWYFPCHFMDDQVLAGSLMADGCVQLMQFFLLYIGMQSKTVDARFHPLQDVPQSVRCRGQVTPVNRKMTYKLEVTEIGFGAEPYAKANVEIRVDGTFSVYFHDLGLRLVEKDENDPFKLEITPNTQAKPALPDLPSSVKAALFNETHIEEFATGSIVACFGDEYAIYSDRRTPRTPNGPLKLVSRVTEVHGERRNIKPKDNLVSEYDVPVDAWYYQENSYPVMPYSILMEIALQPCGFLSAYLGSTLPYSEIDFYFRNLDGNGKLLKKIDLRGKTITNKVVLLSSTAIQGIIIQKFDYQLFCDDELFYEGFASFGYFTRHALDNQVGLDNGKSVEPWYKQQSDNISENIIKIDLNSPAAEALYQAKADKPHYHLAGQRLNLLDSVFILPDSGLHQKGYIYAERAVDPSSWFYKAHFYQDPVMPGSLGVEAILQAMQTYALQLDLGSQFTSPYFEVAQNFVTWKYRGEIYHDHLQMRLEIHITEIEKTPERVTIYGDASLWRNELRMYHVKQIALSIQESK